MVPFYLLVEIIMIHVTVGKRVAIVAIRIIVGIIRVEME